MRRPAAGPWPAAACGPGIVGPFDIEVTMTACARSSLEEKRRALVMLGIALG